MKTAKIITRMTTMMTTKEHKTDFDDADSCDVDFDDIDFNDVDFDNADFAILRLMKTCEIHF
jgi:uncharacterized protein YjbI with pentapeptide repeats